MALNPGQVINNRYRVVKQVGMGGFGAVYRIWDMSLNTPLALKENLDTMAEAQAQFTREATLLASLRHQNLPRVIDYFILPGQGQYLVMDYIEGEDLQQMLDNQGPLPVDQVLPWICEICDALTYLHSQNPPIIHRDVKPANIKLMPDGRVMLVDFGIAKQQSAGRMTLAGARGVSPGFSPPEQYAGTGTDPRSDIYALGTTLYVLLTGQEPSESIHRMTGQSIIQPPIIIRPDIQKPISDAVMRAIELNPSKRFQTATDLKEALLHGEKKRTSRIGSAENIKGANGNKPPVAPPSSWAFDGDRYTPFEMPLKATLEEAKSRVLNQAWGSFAEQIARETENSNPYHGKFFILYGHPGVGTTSIVELIAQKLNETADNNQVVAYINTGQSTDAADILSKVSMNIKNAGETHSARAVRRGVKHANEGQKGEGPVSPDREVTVRVDIPNIKVFGIKIGGPLGFTYIHKTNNLEEKGKRPQDKKPKQEQPADDIKKLETSLDEFVQLLVKNKLRVCLILDKVNTVETINLLQDVFLSPCVTGIVIAESNKCDWNAVSSAERVIYVPRNWSITELILKEMVDQTLADNFLAYAKLVAYLNLFCEGLPKQLLKIIYPKYYTPVTTSNNWFKQFVGIENMPVLHVKKEQILEILLYAEVYQCVCMNDEIAAGVALLSEEKRDQYHAALYNAAQTIATTAQKQKKFGQSMIVGELKHCGIDFSASIYEAVSRKIMDRLVSKGLALKTPTGYIITGPLSQAGPGRNQ